MVDLCLGVGMSRWEEAAAVLEAAGIPYHPDAVPRFLSGFADPAAVARGLVAFLREAGSDGESGGLDAAGALRDTFLLRNLGLFRNLGDAPLLQFPPGSPVFRRAARTIPWILEAQIQAFFPDLSGVLHRLEPAVPSGSPPLGAVAEIVFEDVKTGVMCATTGVYHLSLAPAAGAGRLVLKKTDMRIERAVAEWLAEDFGMECVDVLWTGPDYSVMRPVEGQSLRELSGNPLTEPRRRRWSPAEVARVARVLGEEAALAEHCRLFSRHSGNVLATRPGALAESGFVRIDFGQALLPTRDPYIEAVMPRWHLRRFFPDASNAGYEDPHVYREVAAGYTAVAGTARRCAGRIAACLESALGAPLPEMAAEVAEPVLHSEHVRSLEEHLRGCPPPGEAFDRLYNRFYLDFWQVPGWQEYRPPRDRAFEWGAADFHGLLTPRRWK